LVPYAKKISDLAAIAQPNNNMCCCIVYGPHSGDLVVPLGNATLVDTDSVYPEWLQRMLLSDDMKKVV
jgi:hypothetical protein